VDFVTIRGRAGQASSDQRPLRALELVVGDLDGAIAYRERANIDLLIEINAIMQQVFVPLLRSNRLTQLLQRPSRSRVRGYIAMNHASTAMLDDHEYIQLSKGYGDGEEKVTGNDPLGVQAKKG
jgi:hypothetical protein